MKQTLILLALSLLSFSACACTRHETIPVDAEFVRYDDGYVLHSEILGTDIDFAVLLPESYGTDKDKTYSVVYMLHGYGDNWNSWNGKYLHANTRIATLERQGLSEMIYVFPNGFTTYYCNYYTGKYNYMDMFVDELVPFIDSRFRTIPDREHRSITGYSMGGFGAMVLAEKHPEVFSCSAPLSMSFRTDTQYMAESQSGWDGQWGKIFGGVGQSGTDRLTAYYKAHCPYYQFTESNKETLEKVHWFFTCGDDEENLLIAGDSLHVLLRDRDYAHEYRVGNGGHSSSYWMEALNEVLPFFDHHMNGASLWPGCALKSYSKAEINVAEDGTVQSAAYAESGIGTGVMFCHKGLTAQQLEDAMAVTWSPNTKHRFVYLPCDLNERSVAEWKAFYAEKYPVSKLIAIAFDTAASEVLAHKEDFESILFVEPELYEVKVSTEDEFYFAGMDDSPHYYALSRLYMGCKSSGATFEYRVLQGSGDSDEDRLRLLKTISSYITY